MGNSEEEGSEVAKENPAKKKADDNPWYLLATLYGVPGLMDYELEKKNRVAWNRYFAANLGEERRARLIEEKRHPAEELTPLPLEKLREVEEAFAERCKSSATPLALPPTDSLPNFWGVEFDQVVTFSGYPFNTCRFQDTVFRDSLFSNKRRFSFMPIFGVRLSAMLRTSKEQLFSATPTSRA